MNAPPYLVGGHYHWPIDGGLVYNHRDHLAITVIMGVSRVTTKDQTKYSFNSSGYLTLRLEQAREDHGTGLR